MEHCFQLDNIVDPSKHVLNENCRPCSKDTNKKYLVGGLHNMTIGTKMGGDHMKKTKRKRNVNACDHMNKHVV